MKNHIVIDKKGKWKLMNKEDAIAYSSNGFESHNLFKYSFPLFKISFKLGIYMLCQLFKN